MPTPIINSIISQLSELSGKTEVEKDTMVAGGNALLEVVKQTSPHITATTIANLLEVEIATKTYSSLYISSTGVVSLDADSTHRIISVLIPFNKGDILHYHREATTNRIIRFGFSQTDPSSLNTIEGLTIDMVSDQQSTDHDYDIICPYDNAYLLFYYYNSGWVEGSLQYSLWRSGAYEIANLKEKAEAIDVIPALKAHVFGGEYLINDIDGKEVAQYDNSHYINGSLNVVSNNQYRMWRLNNDKYTHVKVYTRAYLPTGQTSGLTTLAFYVNGAYTASTDCIITERTGFRWYEADVPDGCTTIAVSYRGASGNSDEESVQIIITQKVESDGILKDVEKMLLKFPTDVVPRDISLSEKNEIPSYYLTRPTEPSLDNYNSYLEEKIQSIPEGKHFIFVTDTHWRYNTKKSPALMNYVRKRTGIPFVIFGGDAIHRPANKDTESPSGSGIWTINGSQWHSASESRLRAQMELSEYCTAMKERFGDHFLFVTGNHDLGLANLNSAAAEEKETRRVPYQIIIREAHTSLKDRAVYDEQGLADVDTLILDDNDEGNDVALKAELKAYIKQCYYVDDHTNKLRYIITYTGQGGTFDGISKTIFGLGGHDCLCSQLKFIGSALMTLPLGYDVVITGHWLYNRTITKTNFFNGTHFLVEMLNTYRTGLLFVVASSRDGCTPTFSQWATASVRTRDFSKLSWRGRILLIAGHNHSDYTTVVTQGTTRYSGSLVKYPTNEYPYSDDASVRLRQYLGIVVHRDGGTSYNVPNTTAIEGSITTDCAFDVVTITDDNRVRCTRFGYGNDREYLLPEFSPEEYISPISPEPEPEEDDGIDDEEEENNNV